MFSGGFCVIEFEKVSRCTSRYRIFKSFILRFQMQKKNHMPSWNLKAQAKSVLPLYRKAETYIRVEIYIRVETYIQSETSSRQKILLFSKKGKRKK